MWRGAQRPLFFRSGQSLRHARLTLLAIPAFWEALHLSGCNFFVRSNGRTERPRGVRRDRQIPVPGGEIATVRRQGRLYVSASDIKTCASQISSNPVASFCLLLVRSAVVFF